MSFASLAAQPGTGFAYYFEVSLDAGATTAHRYGTVTLDAGSGNFTEPRIMKDGLGALGRGFGADHSMTTTAFDVHLANTDGAVDWISNRDTYVTQFLGSRWTLTLYLFDPKTPSTTATKVLGIFRPGLNPPSRTAESISFTLTDQSANDLQLVDIPTVRDWMGITDANRPASLVAVAGQQLDPGAIAALGGGLTDYDIDSPVPLLFGTNDHPIQRVVQDCYVVCAVAGAPGAISVGMEALVSDTAVLNCTSGEDTCTLGGATATTTAFVARRTPTITKGGRSWHLIWLDLKLNDSAEVMRALNLTIPVDGWSEFFFHYGAHDALKPRVRGRLWSHPADDGATMFPVKIAQDLVTYYCRSTPTIDTSSFARVAALGWTSGSGSIRPTVDATQGIRTGLSGGGGGGFAFMTQSGSELLTAIRSLGSLGQFDAFINWAGQVAVASSANDYTLQTSTLQTLAEVDCGDFSERIPAQGERGAPYNRLYISKNGQRVGPLDDEASIAATGQVLVFETNGDWLRDDVFSASGYVNAQALNNTYVPRGGSTIRPRVRVRTWLGALDYDLGQFVTFSWTRNGLAGPYSSAVFRIEDMRFAPLQGTVDLELAWFADYTTTGYAPYVLDDETLSTRASGGVRTCTVTTGSNTVAFSSGSLVTDAVAAGDHLIISDSTEAAGTFKRYRALLVASVTDATHLVINSTYSSNDFGSAGPYTISVWELRRGALTYRLNATVYGKLGDSTQAGFFSDGATHAYRLTDG